MNTEEFIKKAKEVHGDKYDYSKVEYINCKTKVCIICPIHGEFWQTPEKHLQGKGCKECGKIKSSLSRLLNNDIFISRAKKVHGDKYDYSKVEYVNIYTKVCIICPIHGEFWQTPNDHLNNKNGCPKCCNNVKKDTIQFIKEAKEVHGDKYDYSKVEYINAKTKVRIICPIHGEFWQKPNNHLYKQGCPKCANKNITTNEFIEQAKEVHGDKYDYSKVEYINNRTKVCIICPIHGEFWQLPNNHLQGKGCKDCGRISFSINKKLTLKEFIDKSKKIHYKKYDYSKVEYVNIKTKVCIICPIHGEFWQIPNDHLSGKGCPYCNESHLEYKINKLLNDNNIEFEREKKFDWLSKQSLDFYLPKYDIAIECQGIQHFEPIKYFGGDENYKKNVIRDTIKKDLLKEHNIHILYYTDLEGYDIFLDEKLIKSEKELLTKINEFSQ